MTRRQLILGAAVIALVCGPAMAWLVAHVAEPPALNRPQGSESSDRAAIRSSPSPEPTGHQSSVGQTDLSEADVTLTTNAWFLITDSETRSTGRDPKTGRTSSDIPGSTYFEDRIDGEISHYAQFDRPRAGKYTILVTAVQDGPYILSIRVFSMDGGSQTPLAANGTLKSGAKARFLLDVDPSQNGQSRLTRVAIP